MATQNVKESRMHTSRCPVCKSEHCNEIEDLFMHWESPESIHEKYPEFGVSFDSIRNHCKWAGLYEKRAVDMKSVCVAVLDRGSQCLNKQPVDARDMITAARLHAELDGKIKNSLTVNNNLNVTIEQIEKKRVENQRIGLSRFGLITADKDIESDPDQN